MQHAHDPDTVFHYSVKHGMAFIGDTSEVFSKLIACSPKLGITA